MENIKNQFAILYAQESLFWHVCEQADWPDSLRAKYGLHCKKVKNFSLENFPTRVNITGSLADDDSRSHYDIDDGLSAKFDRELVRPDSEGGMFACYTDINNVDAVVAWLKENWKGLTFEIEEDNEGANPFCNWTAAETYCKENNLEVENPVDVTILETLKEFDEKIEAAKLEKQEFINTL